MKHMNSIKASSSDRAFYAFNAVFWMTIMFVIMYPLYLICISSISSADAVIQGQVIWRPIDISWDGYKMVFANKLLWISYANSLIYVVSGVIIAITMTMLAAYVMSRRGYPGKSIITWYILITMFISGGLIPTFLVMRDLHLYNTRLIIILLGCFNTWNLMVSRVYMQTSIPEELFESATLDGATHFQYFTRIVVPLSKTIIAVLVVYYGVGKWNDYFSGLVYLKDDRLLPLQTVLHRILASANVAVSEDSMMGMDDLESVERARRVANVAKYCIIIVSTGPAVILYTTMQRYFEKGVMIGSLKG